MTRWAKAHDVAPRTHRRARRLACGGHGLRRPAGPPPGGIPGVADGPVADRPSRVLPYTLLIGGGALAAGELLLGPAREVVAERALPPVREMVSIVPAEFGDESGMLGAALLALDSL